MQPKVDRTLINEYLKRYQDYWIRNRPSQLPEKWLKGEIQSLARLQQFTELNPAPFHRESTVGHITGSAFITNIKRTHILLMLHGKLNKWLQLGGHSDGDSDSHRVALREAKEESGLLRFKDPELFNTASGIIPFDIDIHHIPERKSEAAHYHYDIRFIFETDDRVALQPNNESKNMAWLTLEEARELTAEESMHRQFDKFEYFRKL